MNKKANKNTNSKPARQSSSQVKAQPKPATQAQPKPTAQAQPDPVWAKEADLKELIGSVNYFVKGAAHRFENAEKALKDHEARLKALEDSSSRTTASQQSAPTPQPQQPQSKPAQPAQSSQGATALGKNVHIRKVYRVWDYEARCYYMVLDIWAAKQADPEYTPMWGWVDSSGRIVRLLNKEELKKFIP